MAESIRKLFKEYEQAVEALDVERIVEYFADSFILAGPQGVTAPSRTEFIKLSRQAVQLYKRIRRTSAKIVSMDEMLITDEYSLVKTRWNLTFQKTGDKVVESDITFLVQKTGPEPKIIAFVNHQDDEKVYSELGLMD